MAYPVILTPSSPANTDNPREGASHLRKVQQQLVDLFNLPANQNIPGPITTVRLGPFTNSTGATVGEGDVVTFDANSNMALVQSDVAGQVRPFVVCLHAAVNGAPVVVAQTGEAVVAVAGVVTRGNFLRKSATAKCLEDTGVPQGALPPPGALAIALSPASGPGHIVALLFGSTARSEAHTGYAVIGLSGINGSPAESTYVMAATLLVVRDPLTGFTVSGPMPEVTTNFLTTGAGGLEVGPVQANAWYHIYAIWSPSGPSLAGFASQRPPSAGPILPAPYTHWAYLSSVRTNASGQLLVVEARGARMYYRTKQLLMSGPPGVGADIEVPVSVADVVPPEALDYTVAGFFGLVSTVSTSFHVSVRVVAGSEYDRFVGYIDAPAGSGTGALQIRGPMPNGAQTFYVVWHNDSGTPSGAFIELWVLSYTVPNGDA